MFSYQRAYIGRLQAAIFDWAGTIVDFGSQAPVAVFVALFERRGVAISAAQARGPMGLEKKDHIRAVAALPAVAEAWHAANGRPASEGDIEAMFQESLQLQAACVADYAAPVPGALAAVAACRADGLKIGSTTGYSRPIMAALLPAAAAYGYAPDALVCPDEVPAGRPAPWMIFRNAEQLGVYPMAAIVKVGDTVPDIAEGLNAGVWTVGLTRSGNELGLSAEAAAALAPAELAARLAAVGARLRQAGAHYLIETVADLPPVLNAINARLACGERP
jgi:phosphonoacetaldehyde hydrolase